METTGERNGAAVVNEKSTADERLYFIDDNELGINRNKLAEHHFERSIRRYKKAISLANRQGGLWLDAACGSGYGTRLISKSADYVIGIDIDETTTTYAQKHYGESSIQFRAGDINNLDFNINNLFDAIISVETVEHVADCTPFLQMAYKMLKTGGVAVISSPISKTGGANPLNKYHLNEYTQEGFINLTTTIFDRTEYEIEAPAVFTTGEMTGQIFGICYKIE